MSAPRPTRLIALFALCLGGAPALAAPQKAGAGAQKAPARAAPSAKSGAPGPKGPKGPPGRSGPAPKVRPGALGHLQAGAAAFQRGDYAAAQKQLAAATTEPLRNQDYLLYLLGESELLLAQEAALLAARPAAAEGERALSGAPKEQAQRALSRFQAVARLERSRFQGLGRARAADCLALLGRDGEARTQYLAVLKEPGAEIDVAAVRARLGEIALRAGRRPEARAELRRVYVDHPLHPLAEAALARLRALDETTRLEAGEHVARARAMIQGRRWGEALVELGRVPADVGQAIRDDVDYWAGTAHYRMRRGYDVAADKLLGVAVRLRGERQAEAMFHGARALSRADKDDEAIVRYREVVKAHPASRYAAEASFLVGWLDYNRGRYAQAIPSLQETVRRFSGPFAEDARWYLGFSRYLLGQHEAAIADLALVGKRPGMNGEKGRYWSARALLALGRKDEAIEVLRKLGSGRPLSYYAQLGRLRLRELKIEAPAFPEAAGPAVTGLGAVDEELAKDPALLRVDELLAAGLPVEAGFELRRAEGGLLQRFTAQRALPILFDRYERAQSFQRPHLLSESYGARAILRDPHKSAEARSYWEHVYPLAYRELVEKYAPIGDNPPRYLYTIMQKESAYNPHDVSYADAIGLLQMIPPTSRRVAASLGRPYTDDLLYEPEGNIQLGAWYIGRLLKKFKGQVALGAGSFNAGPKAMLRWLKLSGDRPLDEFIELCSYTQTREYMKKVLDIYAHYVYLWDKEEYLPSLRIDKAYLEDDGIDY